ncbi:MAG: tetratricopeptide repeat protein [Candidatus Altimarinota bacterium]
MSSHNKKWENEPSREGLGILQDVLGVPNSAFLTKGDLALKLQERTAKAQEVLADRLSKNDYQLIATSPDNTQVLERVADGFRTLIESHTESDYQQFQQSERHRDEQERNSQLTNEGLSDIYGISAEIADGVSKLNENAIGIRHSIDYLKDDMQDGFNSLNANSEQQLVVMDKIVQAVNKHGSNSEALLRTIAGITIDQTRQIHEEGKQTRIEIKEAFDQSTEQIIWALSELETRISNGLLDIKKSIDRNGQEIGRKIEDNTVAVYEVNRTAQEINTRIAENTSTIKYTAENSEIIKANQYKAQGRKLFKSGHLQEALNKLKIAFSFYSTDFETNFLLNRIYIKLNDFQSAEQHLAIAKSFSLKNQDDAALSLIEFAKTGDFDSAKKSAAHLLKKLDITNLNREIYIELLTEINSVWPFLKQQSQNESLSSASSLSLSSILFETNIDLDSARKLLFKGYKSDTQIQILRSKSNYLEIIKYLGKYLGENITKIKRFGEFPIEIRSIIK